MRRTRVAFAVLPLSAALLVGVLTREDIKTEAYPDPVHGWAVPTIGAGSTEGVQRGDTITPLGAVQRAHRELQQFEGEVGRCIGHVPLYQEEKDAYLRLAHNIGTARFCASSIASRAIAGDYKGACAAILLYDRAGPVKHPEDRCSHPGNRTCRGLWRDRLETHALCMSAQK